MTTKRIEQLSGGERVQFPHPRGTGGRFRRDRSFNYIHWDDGTMSEVADNYVVLVELAEHLLTLDWEEI